eukprot:6975361-Karenia_brevis.AAC.1
MFEALVDAMGHGKMHPSTSHTIAAAVNKQFPSSSGEIHGFQSLGCHGKFPGNMFRDMSRWLKGVN